MILANVNIGTGPSSGDGDPLRSAFNLINVNFTKIQGNVNAIANAVGVTGVTTVAGRTGNVTLTVNDVISAASKGYVDSAITANLAFTMSNVSHWTSNVTTISAALNQLAQRIWALEHP
jgi:hypothetical protein